MKRKMISKMRDSVVVLTFMSALVATANSKAPQSPGSTVAQATAAAAATTANSTSSHSEQQQEYTVEGMHCSGCEKMLTKKICSGEAYKDKFESCEVKLTDKKKQIGQIKLHLKSGQNVDLDTLQKSASEAGEYKLTPQK